MKSMVALQWFVAGAGVALTVTVACIVADTIQAHRRTATRKRAAELRATHVRSRSTR